MTRALQILMVLFVTSVTAPSMTFAQQQDLEVDPIVRRLDEILQRLKLIEGRLDRIEADATMARAWSVDKAGIIRDVDGRPIGFWGIDASPLSATHVR